MSTFLYILIAITAIGLLFLIPKTKKSGNTERLNFVPFTKTAGANLELLRLINEHRKANGSQQVVEERHLHEACVTHAYYMLEKKQASHDNALARRKYFLTGGFKAYGEITAYGYTTTESLFKAYLKSENHKKIIESPNYNAVGIYTCLDTKVKMYNVVVFGKY